MTDASFSTSVVVDQPMVTAFTYLAAQEGLLVEKPNKLDAPLLHLSRKPPQWLEDQLLEQIVLTPTVLSLQRGGAESYLFGALSGSLIDHGTLQAIAETDDTGTMKIASLTDDILIGVLAARGINIRKEEISRRLSEAMIALVTEEHYYNLTGGRKPPTGIEWIAHLIAKGEPDPKASEQYTHEEFTRYGQTREIARFAEPIINAINTYQKLAAVAHAHQALIRVAVGGLPSAPASLQQRECAPTDLQLLGIVSKGLGVLPHAATLKDSIRLSRRPETAALRGYLGKWLRGFAAGELDAIQQIHREIAQATEAVQRLGFSRRLGDFCTWIALPAAVAEVALALPPVLSTTASVAGLAAMMKVQETEKRYEWAMFGTPSLMRS